MRPPCPICGGSKWARDLGAGRILALPDAYCVLACRRCGQRRLDPQLESCGLEQLYSGAYFNSKKVSATFSPDISVSSVDYVYELAEARRLKFENTLRTVKKLRPAAKTILDVGAATGDFVKLAREQGFHAEGIELSEYAVTMAREQNGIELQRIPLSAVAKPGFYDFIHLNHVFEHFNEPLKELESITGLLCDGGLLYLEVPYQFNVVERLLFLLKWRQTQFTLHSLHHPYFYSPRTMRRLLRANGFEVVRIALFDKQRYGANSIRSRLKQLLWQGLASFSVGTYIEVYAVRRGQ
jgi:SAM-dependent methyltransferase